MADGDRERLQQAGRKGAKVTNALNKRASERAEMYELLDEIKQEQAVVEDMLLAQAANEHIIDHDGNDQDYVADK